MRRLISAYPKLACVAAATGAVVALSMPLSALAADPAPEAATAVVTTAAAAAPAPAVEYRLAPEDVLAISVVNFPELSVSRTTVAPDGRLTLPLLTPVDVTGKTTGEVAALLTRSWKKYVIDPSVTVSLVQKRREEVVMFGQIARPGSLEYRAPVHLIEAIAQAGGALATGDLARVTVTRQSGTKETVDLSQPETRGGTAADLVLGAGDSVYVPERRSQFSVVGEVARPGSYPYKDDMTVLDALTQVGGIRDETADLKAATLTQNGVERPVDLEALLRRGDMSSNLRLGPDDRLVIPEAKNRTYVFGAVAHPGYYLLKDGDRVLDALNACGGPLREASLGDVTLVHIDRAHGTVTTEKLDIGRFLTKGEAKYNSPLTPGDVLYIRDKRRDAQSSGLLGFLQGFSLLNMGANIMNSLRR